MNPVNNVTLFNPETKLSYPLAPLANPKDVGVSKQNAFVINTDTAFMVNLEETNYRMQKISLVRGTWKVTKQTIAPIVEAENTSTAVTEYDPNHAL